MPRRKLTNISVVISKPVRQSLIFHLERREFSIAAFLPYDGIFGVFLIFNSSKKNLIYVVNTQGL